MILMTLIILTVAVFIGYWLFGGAIFAAIVFSRLVKIRQVLFSFLFSILSLGGAIGAVFLGFRMGEENIRSCARQAEDPFGVVASVFGCGILEFSFTVLTGFGLLIMSGLALLFFTRAKNQSWMDRELRSEKHAEVSFDNG